MTKCSMNNLVFPYKIEFIKLFLNFVNPNTESMQHITHNVPSDQFPYCLFLLRATSQMETKEYHDQHEEHKVRSQ